MVIGLSQIYPLLIDHVAVGVATRGLMLAHALHTRITLIERSGLGSQVDFRAIASDHARVR